MQGHTKIWLFLCLCFFAMPILAQEICNNGIDDNGDGLIDLNDPECMCSSLIESSLIPNPSFEDMICCPTANEMLECADSWIQASIATSDYIHTCGNYLGNTSIPAFAPLPMPDGEGAVGFRDGHESNPGYKEYIGACLTRPMVVGDTYRLDFFVGFRDNITGSKEVTLAFFGATNCSEIPFGGNNWNIGCPLNAGGTFELIAEKKVTGSNEWVNVVLEFTPDKPYTVLVLGPNCALNPNYRTNPYFYADRLALAEESEFGVPYESVEGSICENNLILSVEENQQFSYQWYRDGVALVGETQSSLHLENNGDVEGQYQATIISDRGCTLSKIYNLRVPPYYAPLEHSICDGEVFHIESTPYVQEGYFEQTIRASDGCDSIVQLTLHVNENTHGIWQDTICHHDTYRLHDLECTEAGIYYTHLSNQIGCDSLLEVHLAVIDEGEGIELDEVMTFQLGEEIDIQTHYIDPKYVHFTWTDDTGTLLGHDMHLNGIRAHREGTYYIEAIDEHGCGVTDEVQIRLDKSNIRLVLPNVFSPDGNNINDYFTYYSTIALDQVLSFSIFDRWGNAVFQAENITEAPFQGWDGRINGAYAEMGVYTYLIHARFLDNSEQYYAGDLTLIR
jgi:gliding motility-associated-like protein